MSLLDRYEAQATLLGPRTGLDDVRRLMDLEAPGWKPRQVGLLNDGVPQAADGLYYVDSKPPFVTAALPTVTLLSTFLPLWPVTTWTPTPVGYWWPGKEVMLRAFGTITTAATPGNLQVSINFGTAAATGALATMAATALVASQTTRSWTISAYIQCRGIGASGSGGSMFAWGRFNIDTAVITAANLGSGLIPTNAPAAVNVDTTVASGVNVQMLRSGSTAETVTVQDLIFQALN